MGNSIGYGRVVEIIGIYANMAQYIQLPSHWLGVCVEV